MPPRPDAAAGGKRAMDEAQGMATATYHGDWGATAGGAATIASVMTRMSKSDDKR